MSQNFKCFLSFSPSVFVSRYVAHSCNFFLFPTTFGVLDSEFSFQASSVQFLNQYGFDYNKVWPGRRGPRGLRGRVSTWSKSASCRPSDLSTYKRTTKVSFSAVIQMMPLTHFLVSPCL